MSLNNLKEVSAHWYSSKQLMMRELYRGEELEECKMWYQNGQLWQQTFYRDRKPQGEYKSWHANGNPFMRGFYRNGKLEGDCKVWRINGEFVSRNFQREGKTVDEYFTQRKKLVLIKVKKYLHHRSFPSTSLYIIPDLERVVYQNVLFRG